MAGEGGAEDAFVFGEGGVEVPAVVGEKGGDTGGAGGGHVD